MLLSILQNASIRTKVTVLAGFPLLGMLAFAAIGALDRWGIQNSADRIGGLSGLATHVSSFVHETQKERGATAIFLGSGGATFGEELAAQRKNTDGLSGEMRRLLEAVDETDPVFTALGQEALEAIGQLQDVRAGVDSLELPASQAIGYYTGLNSDLLGMVSKLPAFDATGLFAAELVAYSGFLHSKERAGIERALMSKTFANDVADAASIAKIIGLVKEQASYMAEFDKFALAEHKELLAGTVEGEHLDKIAGYRAALSQRGELLAVIQDMRAQLGYGGFIHKFKDGVLRGEQQDLDEARELGADFEGLVAAYDALLPPDSAHREHLEALSSTVGAYIAAVGAVESWHAEGKSASEIDGRIMIDDAPAVDAIVQLLETGGFGQDSGECFDAYTAKINQLKLVDQALSEHLTRHVDAVTGTARAGMFGFLGLTAVLAALSAMLGLTISRRIVAGVQTVQQELEELADGNLIPAGQTHPGDELGDMGRALDRSIEGVRNALGAERVDWVAVGEQRSRAGRLASMVENAPTCIICTDHEGTVTYVNPASERIMASLGGTLPRTADGLVGQHLGRFHRSFAERSSALASQDALPIEGQLELATEVLSYRVSPIVDDGAFLGSMLTWEVITERLEQERAVQVAAEREREQAEELRHQVDEILEVVQAASAGDLTQTVDNSTDGAIGQMGQALNVFFGDLRTSITEIDRNAQTLAVASEQLACTSQNMEGSAQTTTERVDEASGGIEVVNLNVQTVAAGTEEMSASIGEIASNAATAATISRQAVEAARTTEQSMSTLDESSVAIGEVVSVISSIAEQTNLLALNATIEAARAGESGKGFAVVAHEVKELAQQTTEATDRIRGRVDGIQSSTRGAIDSIGLIVEVIEQIDAASSTIASAVEEQTATTVEMSRNIQEAASKAGHVNTTIGDVAQAASGTSTSAAETGTAAQELASLSDTLRLLVAKFQV